MSLCKAEVTVEDCGHCRGLSSLWKSEVTVGLHCGRRKSPWKA